MHRAQDTCVPFLIPLPSSHPVINLFAGSFGWEGKVSAAHYCTGGDEKSPTPRSDPDKGLELMVCKVWVILCPAKPLPALESWNGGGNAGLLLCLWSREQVLQLSPAPTARLGSNPGSAIWHHGKKWRESFFGSWAGLTHLGQNLGSSHPPEKSCRIRAVSLTKPHTHPKKPH